MHLNFCHLCEKAIFGEIGFREKEETKKNNELNDLMRSFFTLTTFFMLLMTICNVHSLKSCTRFLVGSTKKYTHKQNRLRLFKEKKGIQ